MGLFAVAMCGLPEVRGMLRGVEREGGVMWR